jgi:hypothetical protein
MVRKITEPENPQESLVTAAWQRYRNDIETLHADMRAVKFASGNAEEEIRGIAWLLQAQAAAYNLTIAPRSSHPVFYKNIVFEPGIYSWLMPNPDFLYRYAFVDGARRFRICGRRGTSHFLEAQVISGFWGDPKIKLMKTFDFDKFGIAAGESFEIEIGSAASEADAGYIAIDPDAEINTLIIREALYDWNVERHSELTIKPIETLPAPAPLNAAAMVERLDAASRMIRFCFKTFSAELTQGVIDAVGFNKFLVVDTSKDEHASNPSAGYVPAAFDLQQNEALVVEVAPPRARYWGMQVGDLWWQCTDYVHRQSSLNGRQVIADADGKIRIIVAATDPGVANWLDTGGIDRGIILLRWYFAEDYPVPRTCLVPMDRLAAELPAGTQTVTPELRRTIIEDRRLAVSARYR